MTSSNRKSVHRLALLVMAIGIAYTSSARASFGDCKSPPIPQFPNNLSNHSNARAAEETMNLFLLEAGRYRQCIVRYARDNKTRLRPDEVKRLGEEYDGVRVKLKKAIEKWNRISSIHNKQEARRKRAP